MFIQVRNVENKDILVNMDTISLIEPSGDNLLFVPTEPENNSIEVTGISVKNVLWLLSGEVGDERDT